MTCFVKKGVSKFPCGVCGTRDSLQIFYNSKGEARYFRVRHRDATTKRFYYHQQTKAYADKELESYRETLSQSGISLSSKGIVDLGHSNSKNGQIDSDSILKNSWASSSVRIEHQPPKYLDVDQYKTYLSSKYCKSYATALLNNAIKHHDYYDNPSKLLALTDSNRLNILKAMVNLSKFLGTYEEYKIKLKNYGIRWTSTDTAFNGFLSVFSKQHNTLPQYLRDIQPILEPNERLFVKFLSITGLRKNEALTAFNMIIRLNSEGKLCEYYNEELSVLEHFKYKIFLRKTKNAYISFVSPSMIKEISVANL
jgi:hypothetical protein